MNGFVDATWGLGSSAVRTTGDLTKAGGVEARSVVFYEVWRLVVPGVDSYFWGRATEFEAGSFRRLEVMNVWRIVALRGSICRIL